MAEYEKYLQEIDKLNFKPRVGSIHFLEHISKNTYLFSETFYNLASSLSDEGITIDGQILRQVGYYSNHFKCDFFPCSDSKVHSDDFLTVDPSDKIDTERFGNYFKNLNMFANYLNSIVPLKIDAKYSEINKRVEKTIRNFAGKLTALIGPLMTWTEIKKKDGIIKEQTDFWDKCRKLGDLLKNSTRAQRFAEIFCGPCMPKTISFGDKLFPSDAWNFMEKARINRRNQFYTEANAKISEIIETITKPRNKK